MKQQNKIILRCFLNYRSSGKSASAQRQHRAAIKWYFEFYEGRFDLNLKPYKITKKMGTGETKKTQVLVSKSNSENVEVKSQGKTKP